MRRCRGTGTAGSPKRTGKQTTDYLEKYKIQFFCSNRLVASLHKLFQCVVEQHDKAVNYLTTALTTISSQMVLPSVIPMEENVAGSSDAKKTLNNNTELESLTRYCLVILLVE